MSQAASHTPAALAQRDLRSRQAVMLACAAMGLVIAVDLVDGRIGPIFSIGFVLVAATTPLAVERGGLFLAAILPPLLLMATLAAVVVVNAGALQVDGLSADVSAAGRWLAGLVDHGVTLIIGEAAALAAIALRSVGAHDRTAGR